MNRNDGFSPNNTIMARVPGIEDPAAFRANGLVSQMDIGAYDNPGQRVVLINAESGERHPIWAEVDMVPTAPGDRALLIHPAVALDYGTRYIVAFRNLRSESDERLRPNRVFRAYRDGLGTDNAAVEARRPQMERIFDELGEAGIGRGNLHVAWDFTVASQANLTGRLVAMRDDAFAHSATPTLTTVRSRAIRRRSRSPARPSTCRATPTASPSARSTRRPRRATTASRR